MDMRRQTRNQAEACSEPAGMLLALRQRQSQCAFLCASCSCGALAISVHADNLTVTRDPCVRLCCYQENHTALFALYGSKCVHLIAKIRRRGVHAIQCSCVWFFPG